MYGTLLFGESQVRSGHLLVGLLKNERLRDVLGRISRELDRVKVETLSDDFARIVKGSPEEALGASESTGAGQPGEASRAIAPAAMGKQEALRRFASDLTERARTAALDPVTGRDEEIRQVIDILMRRRQNNPILTGEAGVGKTAVVEGFALRIAAGDVPQVLRNVIVRTLDLGLLQAGAGVKGEFENRLKQVIEEVRSSSRPVTSASALVCGVMPSRASVSLFWPMYATEPPIASFPPEAPDWAKSMRNIASSAFMLKPPSAPLRTFTWSWTIAWVVFVWTLMRNAPPAPPFDPAVPAGLSEKRSFSF